MNINNDFLTYYQSKLGYKIIFSSGDNFLITIVKNNNGKVELIDSNITKEEIKNILLKNDLFKIQLKPKSLVCDYTSFNPTGFPHFGNWTNAIRSQVICNLLKIFYGKVHSVYYLNDHGKQIKKLVDSLNGIGKEYVITENFRRLFNKPYIIEEIGLNFFSSINSLLIYYGVIVDEMISETSLSNLINKTVNNLIEKKLAYYENGKIVIKISDQLVCLIDENSNWTYIAGDLSLQILLNIKDKFYKSIVFLGGDHKFHGKMLEKLVNNFKVNFYFPFICGKTQLKINEEIVKLSKRRNTIIKSHLIDKYGYWIIISQPLRKDTLINEKAMMKIVEESHIILLAQIKIRKIRIKDVIYVPLLKKILRFKETLLHALAQGEIKYLYRYTLEISEIINICPFLSREMLLWLNRIFKTMIFILGINVQFKRVWEFIPGSSK